MFFFFKWVRISPETDWYHYQGAKSGTYVNSPTSKIDKDPYELSITSEPSVPPPPSKFKNAHLYLLESMRFWLDLIVYGQCLVAVGSSQSNP